MITLLDATTADAGRIAELHLVSWRAAYRGIVSDHFLEHVAPVNRRETWRIRLAPENIGEIRVRMAFAAPDDLVGFSCVSRMDDPLWGVNLDNLHVRPGMLGTGIGRLLMTEAAAWVAQQHPGRPLHLFVYEKNARARAFYERMQGELVEHTTGRSPDGGNAVTLRYQWRNVTALASLKRSAP